MTYNFLPLLCAIALAHFAIITASQNGRSCDTGSSEAEKICMSADNANVLVVHRYCNKFYKCSNGKPYAYTCPSVLLYDPVKQVCDWPNSVECGDRPISGSDNGSSDDTDCIDNGQGNDVTTLPPATDNDTGNDGVGGTCNCNPNEAPSICAAENSNGILVAHENCNQFYKCAEGVPVTLVCPGDLLYNPYKELCDYAYNVVCGDRVIPEPDNGDDTGENDSDGEDNSPIGGGNCDPSQAPNICAAPDSEGVLVAHENCNQFYICTEGEPVALFCPPNLLFDPQTDRCEWAENVNCENRIIPDDNDGSDNDSDIDDDFANDSENNDNENDGYIIGGGNCDPSQAPSICAAPDSDGILIAHEYCNQFYKCFNDVPVALTCPINLLFNPKIYQCDWPENVDCGDRVIPDPEDESNIENDNDGNDNGNNENDGNDIEGGNNNGTCNCNPEEAPSICAKDDSDGVLIAHENCNQFYKCDHGKPVVFRCPPNTLYNPYSGACDWSSNVKCGDRVIPESDEDDSLGNDIEGDIDDNLVNDNDNGGTCNCNPGEAPAICSEADSEGILVAHENCNQFYKCDHGKPVVITCAPNTLYNPYKEECDWASNVECGDRLIPDPNEIDSSSNEDGANDNGGSDNGDSDTGGNDNDDNGNEGTCNCNPDEAPAICAGVDSDGILIAHENCNKFYKCDHRIPVVFRCPPNTLYNPYSGACDWSNNVECGDRVIPESDEDDSLGNDSEGDIDDNLVNDNVNGGTCNCNPGEAPAICSEADSEGVLVAHENCNQFYKCDHGKPVVITCAPNTLYNPYKEECDWASNVECGDRLIPDPNEIDSSSNEDGANDNGGSDNGDSDTGGNDNDDNGNEGTCNCNPDEAPAICAGVDSDGILIAHETCNKFYKCDHRIPVVFRCPPNTLYNPYSGACDWSNNVECGDRVIPESDEDDSLGNDSEGDIDDNLVNDNDNGGTCNCNPGEAPAICSEADSEGVLVAHENCNQFYKCDHGKPVVITCAPNTLYNPYKEECDWASNVECGDRLIPDPNEIDSSSNENGANDNGGSDNGDSDTGGNDNDDNGNEGTCNCNPDEAPAICAGVDSDGILIAHETCNKFYKCDHGIPVVIRCPPNTLYNPYSGACDWSNNVECGDRVILESDDDDSLGNDSEGDIDDNLVNDNDNGGICNCNPGEAPAICAEADSEGVLVAHENCNQFYKCDYGKPVAITCAPNTLYNPYKEECDWASNVECGDRLIPDPNEIDSSSNENGANDNGGSDNGNSDNGGNDNDDNGNEGTCNCNPDEAPAICAGIDSDGILIANENCNQFYKCDHGKPVAFTCPPKTLYNPYKERCDWTASVDCGDRILPDTYDSGSNENEDIDSGSNDNAGIDNNDSIGNDMANDKNDGDCENVANDNGETCNCNPEEAPSICATGNSNGVLIAHENCNQFYQCSYGNAVAFKCPEALLYNPVKEECDWPSNVDCGDRIIPEPIIEEDSSNDIDDDPEEIGSCHCDPSEAPFICARDDSDGILIAHENCNKFYMCSNGLPIALKCPGNTLYNPYRKQCDWASEVQCGDRVILDSVENDVGDNNSGEDDTEEINTILDDPSQAPSICAESGSEGTLVAHENCNQFYQCSGGLPIASICATELLYNPVTTTCDWPRNVDCGDRIIPDTEDDCACNPRNAPELCSRENSDGKLIAHENCHQFYVCVTGVPVPRYCPWSLVYNIEKEVCDWPQNVKCDNRYIVSYSSINKHFESRQILRK